MPSIEGVFTVSAVDSNGMTASVLVTTVQELMVSPSNLYMDMNGEARVQVLGGTPPYQAVVVSGSAVQVSDREFIYKSPSVFGESQMTVIDSKSSRKKISVYVIKPVSVTPLEAYLTPNAKKEFQVTGGISGDEGIHVVTLSGYAPVHPENSIITYRAPSVTGADYILVTDRSGNQEKVQIDVSSEDFFVSPSNVVRYSGEQTTFNAVKGMSGNMVWSCDQGDIVPSSDTRGITYTAPDTVGEYVITALDNSGKKAQAVVNVVKEKVRITPENVYAGPGDSVSLRVFGGAGGYEVKVVDGIASSVNEDGTFEYLVPDITGKYFVTILDRSGAWTQATVEVTGSSEFEPVVSGGIVYDIVNQLKGIASCDVVQQEDSMAVSISVHYDPGIPIPVYLYLRWKMPDGRYMYVKPWDLATDLKSWGLNLGSKPEPFIESFALSGGLFNNFRIYGDIFAPVSRAALFELGGEGVYRFEFMLKPAGSPKDAFTIPAYLRVDK